MTIQMTHYIGDRCEPPHRAIPGSWVAVQAKPGAAHHLDREIPDGAVVASCGQRIERPDFDPPDYLAECPSCAEHDYKRGTGQYCAHCGKKPR